MHPGIRCGDPKSDFAANMKALSSAETAFKSAVTSSSLPDKTALSNGVAELAAAQSNGQKATSSALAGSGGNALTYAQAAENQLYHGMSTITNSLVAGGAPATSVTAQTPPQ
jgi:hypothetical protein